MQTIRGSCLFISGVALCLIAGFATSISTGVGVVGVILVYMAWRVHVYSETEKKK